MGSSPSSGLRLRAAEDRPEPGPGAATNLQLHEGVQGGKGHRQGAQEESGEHRCFGDQVPRAGAESMDRTEDKEARRVPSQIRAPPRIPWQRRRSTGPRNGSGWCRGDAHGRALVCSQLSERRGEARAAPGPAGSLCTSPGSPHSALGWDLPLKEALFHVQAVDSEVFQGRII